MKKYYWSHKDRQWIIALSAIIVLLWVILIAKGSIVSRYHRQSASLQEATTVLSNQIIQKQNKLNYQAQENAVNSKKPSVRNSSRQLTATVEAQNIAKKVFSTITTYSSQAQYKQNQKKVTKYLDKKVQKSKILFASDKDTTGDSYINTAKVHSSFVSINTSAGMLDGDNLPVMVKVVYDTRDFNKDAGQTQQIFMLTYNYKQKKITDVQKPVTLYQGAINN